MEYRAQALRATASQRHRLAHAPAPIDRYMTAGSGRAHQRSSQSHGGGRLAGSGIGSVSGPFVFSPYRNQVGSLSLFSVGRSRRAAKSGRQGPPVSSEPRAGGPPLSSIRARVLTPSVPRLSFRYLFRREDRALLIQHPATGRYLARRALPRR